MKIAVTGASGRIGNVVVRKLVQAGHEVRILQRRESRALEGLQLEKVQGHLLDQGALDRLVEGCAVVIHLAALISVQGGQGGQVHQTNVDGTRYVLGAAVSGGVRRIVHFSSIHAFYQLPAPEVLDETRALAFHSRMAYDRSKAEAMHFAMQTAAKNDLEIVALCPTSVIGPFDFAPSIAGKMFLDLYHRKIPLLVPGGFDWCDVRDVADAAVTALHKGRNGAAYLLSGRYATLLEIAQIVWKVTGKPTPKHIAPDWLLRFGLPFVHAFSKVSGQSPIYTREALDTLRDGSRYISSEKARSDLDYSARPLEDSIADVYYWFKQNGYL